MQWLRAPFRNPVGQAVAALTDWAVKPLRRVGAGIPRHRLVDVAPRLARAAPCGWSRSALRRRTGRSRRRRGGHAGAAAVVEIVKAMLWLLIIAVIAQAILSWTSPTDRLRGCSTH